MPAYSNAQLKTALEETFQALDTLHISSSAHPANSHLVHLDQPLPPPPPFNGRHMLPPSSPQTPQAPQSLHAPLSQRPPPPPPFSGNRELPALSNAPRPGSSMSISSMLGTELGRPGRESITFTNTPAAISSTASPSVPLHSPTRLHQTGLANQGSHSPERYKLTQTATTRPFRAYSGGSPQRSTSSAEASVPEVSNFGVTQPIQPLPYSPASDTGSRQHWKAAFNGNQYTDRLNQRPNSQPSGYSTSPLEIQMKMQQQSTVSEIDELRRLQSAKRYLGSTEAKNREAAVTQTRRDYGETQAMSESRSAPTVERKHLKTSTYTSPDHDRPNGSSYPFLARSSAKSEATNNQFGPQADYNLNHVLERNPPAPTNLNQSPFSPESLRRLREERLVTGGSQQHSATHSLANQQARFSEHAGVSRNASVPANLGAPSTGDSVEHQHRTGEEMSQAQKNSLFLFMENQKRGGRISPLPQAVQGAQGKISTPASDPGIKSEFARMFIGIGSGVGSAGPMRSETSTPFQRSPIRTQEPERRTPFGSRSDLVEQIKPRAGSRGGRRVKKLRNDEPKVDVENKDGRASARTSSSRGVKKSKAHQYFSPWISCAKMTDISSHHVTGHHHHHFDEEGKPILHHHHHHLDHHHRRHGPTHQHKTAAASPAVPPRIPKININNDSLLESVRQLPRHHLGSTLYSPSITSINSKDPLHIKLGYTSTPKPLPRFDSQENSTFTVRIPRFYLTPTEREEICRRRTLWGSDVYTDDSDPVAAAIHAGWIRGDWGDDIDLSMLGIDTASNPKRTLPKKGNKAIETVFSLPSQPIRPPPGKDLHLTLLILPTLQSYASTTAHGIKSRTWGHDHDGVSFKIEKIAWVDEGAENSEERGGEARRKRMRFSGMRAGLGPGIKSGLVGRKNMAAEGAGVGVVGVGA